MKITLILAPALSLLISLAAAQETPPEKQPAKDKDVPAEKETVRKAAPAAWLGILMSEEGGEVQLDQVLPESPAAKAGLKPGDVLLSIGDRAIESDPSRVAGHVAERKPGDTIALRIRRGDNEETIKVELAERPDTKEEFRGEFRRKTDEGVEKAKKELEAVKEKVEKARDEIQKEFKDNVEKGKWLKEELDQRVKEKIAEAEKNAAKLKDSLKENLDDRLRKYSEQWKDPGNSQFKREFREEKLLKRERPETEYFEYRVGPDGPELRLEKMPAKPGAPGNDVRVFVKPDKKQEDAIWKRVEDSVGRALKESGLNPDVIEKALHAVREARKNGPEQEARRAKLKAEAERIEKEMQMLKDRADKLRDELRKSGE